ncbi:zinc ribbon domain-containing protein [Nakamurella endophytica]|uniref:C4-type zinc ribbon domain-containing protein n=1 Tax=Nakamurella endophytica TaxID=1748367 RepID=A0A917WNS3_9ACTN|nr:C4-type zinc ribbon domain-containing protein [Nakamurella endophytica]GGM17784.1 hypothetical protein GCM10011594_42360 [Nakamurella endophytica]
MAVPKADPFAQRRLLELATLDRSLSTVEHRTRTLPELAVIAAAEAELDTVAADKALADAELGDLDRATRKLDAEVEQVRARADRDAARLAAGSGTSRELENLQHEIESLARRQGVLEDEELELMEQRETAEAAVARLASRVDEVTGGLTAARTRRDDALADLSVERDRLSAARAALVTGLPADLVTLYDRIHAGGRVAAGELRGSRCEACSMQLDNVELARLRNAPVDDVLRCPECGAILVRT